MLGLKRLLKPMPVPKLESGPRRWECKPSDLPWFDQPDALENLGRKRDNGSINSAEFDFLEKWVRDGYVILPYKIDGERLESVRRDLEAIWTADTPRKGLLVPHFPRNGDGPLSKPTHEELLSIPLTERLAIRDSSNWRVHAFFEHSEATRSIYKDAEILRYASMIFGEPCNSVYTINFMYGSRQKLHQDTAVFHIFPPNYLLGAWIGCEDISADAGPLVYYPGSHREPMFPGFDNYPQTNLKTCSKELSAQYQEYVDRLSEKYERRQFLAKKGEILFWHGMLIHGGDEVRNSNLTRNSYVCHYVPPGRERDSEVVGPFNW